MHKEPWLPRSLNFFNLFKYSNRSVNGQLLHHIRGITPSVDRAAPCTLSVDRILLSLVQKSSDGVNIHIPTTDV